MPRIKLSTNLGLLDARRFGLDVADANEGVTVDVSKEVFEELVRMGWGTGPSSRDLTGPALPVSAPAEPEPETEAEGESETDFSVFTKEELKAYADQQQIPGVSMAQSKADMIATIEAAEGLR